MLFFSAVTSLLSSGLRADWSPLSYSYIVKREHLAVLRKAHPSVSPVKMLISLQTEAIIAIWYVSN